MERERKPSWQHLAELWLKTHFSERSCVVFMDPMELLPSLRPWFIESELVELINADFAVYVTPLKLAMDICDSKTLDGACVLVWDGKAIVHENT